MISQGQKEYLQTASKVFSNLCRNSEICVKLCYDDIDHFCSEYGVLSCGVYDDIIYRCPDDCENATEEKWYKCLLEAKIRDDLEYYGKTDLTMED